LDDIERYENQIEELREAIQRSRRLIAAGWACALAGPTLLACLLLSVIDFTPARMIAAIALAIGGLVLTGSSQSSTNELERSLQRANDDRIAAIDALNLVPLSTTSRSPDSGQNPG
jgi:hypothetical protein